MRKKIVLLIAAVAAFSLSALLLAGCSGSGASSSSSASASSETSASASASASTSSSSVVTQDISTLIVGFDAGYPPYGYIGEDGQYTGFDLELAAAVAEDNGWTLQLEPIDWDSKDALLGQGTINCIWNGFTMEGREDDYTFSDPYMLNQQVVVVKADSGIDGNAALEGKTVMTQMGSAALDVLEGDMKDLADTFAELQTIGDYNNAFMQLDSGAVDAVACDLSIAKYQMAANPDKYVMLEPALSSEHYAVGFAKGEDQLAQKVTDSLLKLYENGTVEQLCQKYGDMGITIENWVLTPEAGNAK